MQLLDFHIQMMFAEFTNLGCGICGIMSLGFANTVLFLKFATCDLHFDNIFINFGQLSWNFWCLHFQIMVLKISVFMKSHLFQILKQTAISSNCIFSDFTKKCGFSDMSEKNCRARNEKIVKWIITLQYQGVVLSMSGCTSTYLSYCKKKVICNENSSLTYGWMPNSLVNMMSTS